MRKPRASPLAHARAAAPATARTDRSVTPASGTAVASHPAWAAVAPLATLGAKLCEASLLLGGEDLLRFGAVLVAQL